ncbi:hypothetical protein BFJ65_g2871 [Fusarium oxysporum f. sp. cepae]|uniref:Uncharacterized protein n=1 Tax=Fusarium oxysporum f. sp. cepae TaxID=396571 RepID=A0A3L6P0L1_FUSOX|nr:hypothetical protein BFJ65_g2871 [Fusarium oxysporum f. sp. cepae]RKK62062.1 hypothetical protein BFJ67_g1484 [Fusarium oxysporum f. sp. cepae]
MASTEATLASQEETSSSESSERSPDGLKGGPVAGVAIGCLIAGLALGSIAAFLLLRRRRRVKPANEGFVLADQKYTEPKDGTQVIVSSSRHDAELSQFLLEATPDKDLQAELRSLSELIYQHVENYYRRPQVQADAAEVAQSLTNIGYSPEASGLQADTVAAICLSPKTSQIGLRHVLSHVIFRSLDFSSGSSLSMLPLAVATMAQRSRSAENANNPAITLARSRWRALSALLLHPNPEERTPLPVSVTEASPMALSLANEFNQFLEMFVTQDPASQQDQMNHLQAVILECTKLGYVVLSQPSDWGFVFSNRLQEVCEIVERCRPEADRGGKTTFSKRMAWVLVDASEFKSQEPIVSRHHAAVLAELNFLRQIALLAPVPEPVKVKEKCGVRDEAAVFDNVALLGDLLGDVTGKLKSPIIYIHRHNDLIVCVTLAPARKPPIAQSIDPPTPTIVFNTNAESATPTTPSSLQVPQPLHRSTSSQTMHIEHAPEPLPELVPVNMNSTALPKSFTSSATYDSESLAGLSLLLGDPLDWKHSPPLAPSNNGPLNRPVTAPSQGLPAQSTHNGSDQHLPLNSPYDSVSDLSQTSQRASFNCTPSRLSSNISSPYHQQHSLPIPPAATRSASQLHHMSSGHYPGQLTWSNSSSTTISSISSGLTRHEYSWIPPIAELDSSPHHVVPIVGALNHLNRNSELSVDQKLAIQINTTPVELPAEDRLPTNINPYCQLSVRGLTEGGEPSVNQHQHHISK